MTQKDVLRGHRELHYERLLGDVHRSLVGGLYVGGGCSSGNYFTKDRIRARYGDETDTDPIHDVKLALVYGQEAIQSADVELDTLRSHYKGETLEKVRDSRNPLDDDFITDEDFYADATDSGDLDTFLSIAESNLETWYHVTVDALQWRGYDEPTAENLLIDLANEVHTPEQPYERVEPGLADRIKGLF